MYRRCCRPVAWSGGYPQPGHRPATSWVHYTTSCKHSLVLLKMGEIIARNIGIINKPLLSHLVGCPYYLCTLTSLRVGKYKQFYEAQIEFYQYFQNFHCTKIIYTIKCRSKSIIGDHLFLTDVDENISLPRYELFKCFALVNDQLDAQLFHFIIRLLQSSTCFEQRRAHHQEVKLY